MSRWNDPPLVHLNLAARFYGGERQTELLIRELAGRGRAQRLVCRHGHPLAARCADVDGVDVRTVAANPLAAALACRGARCVHVHDGRALYAGLLARLLFGIDYLVTYRLAFRKRRRRMKAVALQRAAAVIAVSRASADTLRADYPEIDCRVIHDAHAGFSADEPSVASLRRRYAGKTVIGHVGSLDHATKGQLTIFEAARGLQHSRPELHFVLLGDGPDADLFRERAAGLANVEMPGFVDNVGDYLAVFHVFAFPSLHDALGSSLLDAMAAGLPIVASRVGGIPEIVTDGVNGLLIEPEEPVALSAAILRIVDDTALYARLAAGSRQRAAGLSVAAMADAYARIYES